MRWCGVAGCVVSFVCSMGRYSSLAVIRSEGIATSQGAKWSNVEGRLVTCLADRTSGDHASVEKCRLMADTGPSIWTWDAEYSPMQM